MRLNETTYPAYYTLLSGNYEYLKIDQLFGEILDTDKKFLDFIESVKYTFKQVDKKYYLTNTFKESILTAMPKIVKDNKHYNDIPCHCGIIFTDKGFSVYLSNPTDKKLKLLVFGFTRDVLTTYGIIDNDYKFSGMACSIKDGKPYNDTEGLATYLNSFLVSLYFINNCEIEEVVLKPNMKHRENGNKHYNESKSDVIILDCKWFTDLIRSIPFHVKGHLRWQHYGEKFTKRKLIWIPDFEKKGYIRKAGKNLVEN
jgi:hypothetical protein